MDALAAVKQYLTTILNKENGMSIVLLDDETVGSGRPSLAKHLDTYRVDDYDTERLSQPRGISRQVRICMLHGLT